MCFTPQRPALFRHHNFQKCSDTEVFCSFWLRNVLRARTACTFSTSQLPKVLRDWGVLFILTSKCASRHNGVHFFDVATSKSGPTLVCFLHFDFDMCFAPQRRALFRHHDFQKCSDTEVFCSFWLRNVLRATTACTFSTSPFQKCSDTEVFCSFWFEMWFAPQRRALFRHLNFQKWSDTDVFCTSRHNGVHFFDTTTCKSAPCLLVFRAFFRHRNVKKWSGTGVLYFLHSKCASRHNGVHFFDITTSVPTLRSFVHFDFETCFAPQRRALFRHHDLQKCSVPASFPFLTSTCAACRNGVHFFDIATSKSGPARGCCTFWLRNVLRTTTVCTFSTSQLPKVVRA